MIWFRYIYIAVELLCFLLFSFSFVNNISQPGSQQQQSWLTDELKVLMVLIWWLTLQYSVDWVVLCWAVPLVLSFVSLLFLFIYICENPLYFSLSHRCSCLFLETIVQAVKQQRAGLIKEGQWNWGYAALPLPPFRSFDAQYNPAFLFSLIESLKSKMLISFML